MSDQMHYLSMIKSSDALRMPSIVSSQSPASDKSSHSKSIPKQYSSLNVPMPSDVHSNPEILLSWESLNYTVNQKRRDIQVLQNVSGFANPKELLVIMGSSGSGKSTLLNVLAKRVDKGNNIKLSGNVKANGYDVNGFKYREYVGYVTQDDILMETLTPRETLDFAANLRLSSNQKYNNLRIKKLIKQLSLSKVQNKPIGNPLKKIISGGERKRVAIAYELITDPSILFLDEPTSGLDSYTADLLMQILVNQARRGHTIICTLHQPSFNMYQNFDRLILMIQGFIVYQAPAKYAVKYFKNIGFEAPKLINPPDYFMKIVHIKNRLSLTPEEQANLDLFKDTYNINQDFVSSFKASINLGDQLAALESESTIYRPTYLTQLKYTFIRAMKNAERNRVLTRVVIFQTVFLIILLDLIFNNLSTDYEGIQSRNGILYYVMIPNTFLPMQTTLLTCNV